MSKGMLHTGDSLGERWLRVHTQHSQQQCSKGKPRLKLNQFIFQPQRYFGFQLLRQALGLPPPSARIALSNVDLPFFFRRQCRDRLPAVLKHPSLESGSTCAAFTALSRTSKYKAPPPASARALRTCPAPRPGPPPPQPFLALSLTHTHIFFPPSRSLPAPPTSNYE